jgi:hypothetical protein
MRFSVRFGLRHPILALRVVLRRKTVEQAFGDLLRAQLRGITERYDRLRSEGRTSLAQPPEQLQATMTALLRPTWPEPVMALTPWHGFLYLAAREARPRVVVETGVWYGWSSAALLQALHDNGEGRLISIDLPTAQQTTRQVGADVVQSALLAPSHSVGSSVPSELRDRWDLRLGDALRVLPELFRTERPISIFIHDSLHTYDHMTAEYTLGFEALAPGGLLVSDDIRMNAAWEDFCRSHGIAPTQLARRRTGEGTFGFGRKPGT